MSILLDALKFTGILLCVLLIFNFIIIVHEWGHFLAARWRGLKIEKFQIWMGKCIWKRTWNGVQYGLGSIPLGGFVQLPQMAPMAAIEGKASDEALPPIKPLDKIIVAFAGPLFSFLLAVLFACAVHFAGKPVRPEEVSTVIGFTVPGMPAQESGQLKPGDTILEIDGHKGKGFHRLADSVIWAIVSGRSDDVEFKIQREGETQPRTVTVHAPYKDSEKYKEWEASSWFKKLVSRPPLRQVGIQGVLAVKVKKVMAHGPAEEAGLQEGDLIKTINGEQALNPTYLDVLAERRPNDPIKLTVERAGKIVEATIIPRVPDDHGEKAVALAGIETWEVLNHDQRVTDHPAPFELIGDCFRNTAATMSALVSPSSPVGPGQMSGPVGILNLYYNLFKSPYWWQLVLWFSVVLNVGLAIFNLLPLPVLDGGHIVMALLEKVRGKALGTKLLEYVQLVCVLALLSFVLFVTFKDVGGIFGDKEPKEAYRARSAPVTP